MLHTRTHSFTSRSPDLNITAEPSDEGEEVEEEEDHENLSSPSSTGGLI